MNITSPINSKLDDLKRTFRDISASCPNDPKLASSTYAFASIPQLSNYFFIE